MSEAARKKSVAPPDKLLTGYLANAERDLAIRRRVVSPGRGYQSSAPVPSFAGLTNRPRLLFFR